MNLQPRDPEGHALPTEPARCPRDTVFQVRKEKPEAQWGTEQRWPEGGWRNWAASTKRRQETFRGPGNGSCSLRCQRQQEAKRDHSVWVRLVQGQAGAEPACGGWGRWCGSGGGEQVQTGSVRLRSGRNEWIVSGRLARERLVQTRGTAGSWSQRRVREVRGADGVLGSKLSLALGERSMPRRSSQTPHNDRIQGEIKV